ncbi:DUF2798 domain-containing protein [Rhizobium sp. KVB221]|uniref:DUF2798 domain-containing protein n=1 Tax=Rhizobium setariae TaxID=2801340 RepID=A0A937CNZ7_9HYPH|nr:DUF2798 domain-containing protein [Rhizobium setariae]MBL0372594.1 DUF2798 domain-containing protein [Rhizobium setariae]
MNNTSAEIAARRPFTLGLPRAFTPYVFSFYMAFIMSFVMSAVLIAVNAGIQDDFGARLLASWRIAFPTAFVIVLGVRPIVLRLVALTVRMA